MAQTKAIETIAQGFGRIIQGIKRAKCSLLTVERLAVHSDPDSTRSLYIVRCETAFFSTNT